MPGYCTITCAGCGTQSVGRSDATYCSSACRQKAYRRRNRARTRNRASVTDKRGGAEERPTDEDIFNAETGDLFDEELADAIYRQVLDAFIKQAAIEAERVTSEAIGVLRRGGYDNPDVLPHFALMQRNDPNIPLDLDRFREILERWWNCGR
jgi:hypothetical protein